MAGGSGTRFWPLSRERRPKQFLPIASPKTMLEETVDRLRPLLPPEEILTVSNKTQAAAIRKLLPGLPRENILVEPLARNTAASLILATARVHHRNPKSVVLALPADHLIGEPDVFVRKLRAAAAAAAHEDVIVTFGVPPTYPSTGFGYIHFSTARRRFAGEEFHPVLRFTEKPSVERARKYLKQGRHRWNSGMFIYRAEVFARKLEKYSPEFFVFWKRILAGIRKDDTRAIAAAFRDIPATSIDYALMEKARGVLMAEGDFGWSDVGSWASLAEIWPKDNSGNALRGEALFLDSRNCLVYSPHRQSAVVGLRDVIIIDTEDALLVCSQKADQRVKEVIEELKKRGRKTFL
jgi:mannose-1-phosphate guanylyltransferase